LNQARHAEAVRFTYSRSSHTRRICRGRRRIARVSSSCLSSRRGSY